MKTKILGLLAVGLLAGVNPANAAIINADYTFVVTGATGPVPNHNGSFSLRYDDTLLSTVSLTAINYTLGGFSFNTSNAGAEWAGSSVASFADQFRTGGLPTLSSVSCDSTQPTDFFLRFDFKTLAAQSFAYNANGLAPSCGGAAASAVSISLVTAPVPEPGTLALLGLGLAGLGLSRRRKA